LFPRKAKEKDACLEVLTPYAVTVYVLPTGLCTSLKSTYEAPGTNMICILLRCGA
jgi:hypothetical protein